MSEQYGFYVDTSRCIKCWACQVACKQWNGIKAGTVTRRWLVEEFEGAFPEVNRRFTTTSCRHCESPACMEACPAGAISKREEDGAVVVDGERCVGCQTCAAACPYGVPQYEPEGGRMDKCDACAACGRTEDRDLPRCVATCPTQALHWGTLAEMAELAAKKGGAREEGDTLPCVFIS